MLEFCKVLFLWKINTIYLKIFGYKLFLPNQREIIKKSLFHHPYDFKHLLLILYIEILTNYQIPAFYILLSGKKEDLYEEVFSSVIRIIIENNKYKYFLEAIVTDGEISLIAVKNKLSNVKRISCYFHYKQDVIHNLCIYCLWKKNFKNIRKIILKKLSLFPIIYNGEISIIYNSLEI